MIKFNDVVKTYGKQNALGGVSFEIKENGIYCLLGRNGAGKTTLLKLTAGFFEPTAGEIFVGGKKVGPLSMPPEVTFIEERNNQFNLKIKDLIAAAKAFRPGFDATMAAELIKKFGLDGNKKYNALSFGMKTMVATLIGLASKSPVLILDEPVLGLDAIMREKFYRMLAESYELNPCVIIISTHLIDEIARVAGEILLLDKGKLLLRAPITEIQEKSYTVTGLREDVDGAVKGLNVVSVKGMGRFCKAYVYDRRISGGGKVEIENLGLQEFFVSMVGGEDNE